MTTAQTNDIIRTEFTEYGVSKVLLRHSSRSRFAIIEIARDGIRANALSGKPEAMHDAVLSPSFHGRRFKTLSGAERAARAVLVRP